MNASGKDYAQSGDPLRRTLVAGGVIGFLLILATLAICYTGVKQINKARDAQAALDQSERYLQGAMRGLGELILSEGASAQIKGLQANLLKADEALGLLASQLPEEASRRHFAEKIQPAWKSISDAIVLFTKRRGVNAGNNEVMAAYGKQLAQMEAFESDFAEMALAANDAVERATRYAYWLTSAAMVVVLALFVMLNLTIQRRIRRGLGGDLSYAIAATREIARGDLSVDVQISGKDDSSLLHALQAMNTQLTGMVGDIRSGAESIRNAAEEVAAGNNNLSQRTEEQAATLQETAASMEALTATVRENTQSASNASALAREANTVAAQGGAVVGAVVVTMNEIQESSKKIGDIISVIDSIAFQTNILALNAAVEAARAGDQGRGFAVVASEVRALAQRSAQAAKEIKTLINLSVEKVAAGTRQVESAGNTMSGVVASVEKVALIVEEISSASREQASGIEQVNKAVSEMDQVVQQNAAVVEQAAAAAESMQESAQQLFQAVSVFKLGGIAGNADVARPAANRRAAASSVTPSFSTTAVPRVALRPQRQPLTTK